MRVKSFTSICHRPISELTNHPRVIFLRQIHLYVQFLMVLPVAPHKAFGNWQTPKRSKFDSEPFAEASRWRKAAEEAVAPLPTVTQSLYLHWPPGSGFRFTLDEFKQSRMDSPQCEARK